MQEAMYIPRTRQGVRNLDIIKGPILPISGCASPVSGLQGIDEANNLGSAGRVISMAGGAVLLLYGLRRFTPLGLGLAGLGGALLCRGALGYCPMSLRSAPLINAEKSSIDRSNEARRHVTGG